MPNDNLFIYKISFKKYLSTHSTITDADLDKIANLEIESSFDYEKDDLYFCYVITNEMEIEKYKKILEKNYIDFDCINISNLVLKNEYDLSYIKNYIDSENYYLHDMFIEDLEQWIYDNLDLDLVLDMISYNGIDSLRPVDKKFLKNNYEN